MKLCLSIVILSLILVGCATSTKKTADLKQGMTMQQVQTILGPPDTVEVRDGLTYWKYYLQQIWVGLVPHYLAFNKDGRLVGWKANPDETQRPKDLNMNILHVIQ